MLFDLKNKRNDYRWSQVKLANESGVSLPTIQNIESGKANPTLEVLEKLFTVFGLEIRISSPLFNAERAAAFGVPFSVSYSDHEVMVTKNTLKLEARKWFLHLKEKQVSERDEFALVAFLKGVKDQ
jgi:transcriptional regulator with XRE-family HTH domain